VLASVVALCPWGEGQGSGVTRLDGEAKGPQHDLEVKEDVVIPEAEHGPALSAPPAISLLVVGEGRPSPQGERG
jgi:hypothetical protein